MHRLRGCGKTTNTTAGLFQFFKKNRGKQKKKEKLALACCCWRCSSGERTVRVKQRREKACPTSSGKREEKFGMYLAALGCRRRRRRGKKSEEEQERWQHKLDEEGRSSFFDERETEKEGRRGREREKKRCRNANVRQGRVRTSQSAMLMNSSIVDDNFLCVLSLFYTISGERLRRRFPIIIILVMRTSRSSFFSSSSSPLSFWKKPSDGMEKQNEEERTRG